MALNPRSNIYLAGQVQGCFVNVRRPCVFEKMGVNKKWYSYKKKKLKSVNTPAK
jgi:hypothetical protein